MKAAVLRLGMRSVLAMVVSSLAFFLMSSPALTALGPLGYLTWRILDAPVSALTGVLPGFLQVGIAVRRAEAWCAGRWPEVFHEAGAPRPGTP